LAVVSETGGREAVIELVEGDITLQSVDAIVNAANAGLAGGGGVDGAIHRAAGPRLMDACRAIGGCPAGNAVLTPGFDLPARFVIHTVGPIWDGGRRGEPELLRSAYRSSLEIANRERFESIALPSVSTGAYRYPLEQAARIALATARDHLAAGSTLRLVRFVLYGPTAYEAFAAAAEELKR